MQIVIGGGRIRESEERGANKRRPLGGAESVLEI